MKETGFFISMEMDWVMKVGRKGKTENYLHIVNGKVDGLRNGACEEGLV